MRLWILSTAKKNNRSPLPFLVVTSLLVAVLAISCFIIARAGHRSVEIIAWDRHVRLAGCGKTVADALRQAGIVLGPADSCVPAPDEPIEEDMKVHVTRAVAVSIMQADGVTTVLTSEKSIDAILALAGVTCGPHDKVIPGTDQEVPESGLLRIVRVTYDEVTEDEEIPFGTERREDGSLEAGLVQVHRSGTPGLARVTYSVCAEDGVEVSRQETRRDEVAAPTSRVLLVGTLREVSRGGSDIRFQRAVEVLSTAYCPCAKCCGPNAKGITHLGVPAKKGVIAVDPRVIPLGSRVYVDGYGFALAADTGSAIKGERIDVCFDSHEEALSWGMQRLKVYVLE